MSLKLKNTLPFFLLFSLLLVSVFAPIFVSSEYFDTKDKSRPGTLVIVNFIGGNICCPESRSDAFLRGETRFFPALGTGILSALTRSALMFLPIAKLLHSNILHSIFNPVKIAQYYHLGDGMK